ncbi:MAG: efflux RND transporter periplasmic adaptor subunit [Wolinella sp.]
MLVLFGADDNGTKMVDSQLVSSATIRAGSIENLGEFIGTLYFGELSELASEVSGVVENLTVNEGMHVKKGDVLARLGSELLQKDIASKEATLKQARAKASKASKEFERLSKLHSSSAVSFKEFEDARFDKEAEEGNAESVLNELLRLKSELVLKQLKAPFDGVIIKKLLNRGEWVASGAAVFSIARLDSLEASVDVPFEVAQNLRIGESVRLTIAQREYSGKVKAIIPLGDAKARTFPVKIALNGANGELFEGLSVRAKFKLSGKESGLLIPRDAIVPREGKNLIFVIRDSKAMSVSVEVLSFHEMDALVRSDSLSVGERVVVRGQERLRTNQAVREQ